MTMSDSMWRKVDERSPSRTARCRSARPARRQSRPSMEPLEERRIPAVFTVSTPIDRVGGPDVSLREAIRMANASPGPDTIDFEPDMGRTRILLTHGPLHISDDLTILGPQRKLTINGNDASQLFQINRNGGSNIMVQMSNLRLTKGSTAGGGGAILNQENLTLDNVFLGYNVARGGNLTGGGAIFNKGGNLTLRNCSLHENRTEKAGGAIFNDNGQVTIKNTGLTENIGQSGGALYSLGGGVTLDRVDISKNTGVNGSGVKLIQGTLSATDTTLAHNKSTRGGALDVFRSTVTIAGTTISNNESRDGGSAITASASTSTLTNSTIGDNDGGPGNDAALELENGSMTLRNVTVAAPKGNVGIRINGTTLTLNNCIVAGPRGSCVRKVPNSRGGFIVQGTNLVQDGGVPGPGILSGDPLLGPLAYNGGPTQTFEPQAGSPAIDAGDLETAFSPRFDQRGAGFDRIAGKSIDLGAVEVQEPE